MVCDGECAQEVVDMGLERIDQTEHDRDRGHCVHVRYGHHDVYYRSQIRRRLCDCLLREHHGGPEDPGFHAHRGPCIDLQRAHRDGVHQRGDRDEKVYGVKGNGHVDLREQLDEPERQNDASHNPEVRRDPASGDVVENDNETESAGEVDDEAESIGEEEGDEYGCLLHGG
jgi:hypothetical protein